ncbi:MAG: NAD(P)-dependent oxidoreductase [Candidatus Eremiobacteraeota bacterium]|nr:NAD(P)-dependent oxidoreductase [Candidatus Eremiobacteraeota bacterium]
MITAALRLKGGAQSSFNPRFVPERMTVGFVGIGTMGEPMVRCLLRAGYQVVVSAHQKRERVDRVVSEGAHEAKRPSDIAEQCDFLITCVPDAPHVEDAIFGRNGLFAGTRSPKMFVDMSTISPLATVRFAERLIKEGHRFADAPVSGGPARAADGSLTIMVGATEEDFAAASPVLSAMGNPTRVGAVGMGETVKLTNQILIANIMLANAEALSFARKAGADPSVVRDVIATATGANYLLQTWLPKTWFSQSFEGGFAMDLLRKDLNAALEAARSMNLPMPSTALASQFYTAQAAKGDAGRDYSAVAKFYEQFTQDSGR